MGNGGFGTHAHGHSHGGSWGRVIKEEGRADTGQREGGFGWARLGNPGSPAFVVGLALVEGGPGG
jgi:hypothetical protein